MRKGRRMCLFLSHIVGLTGTWPLGIILFVKQYTLYSTTMGDFLGKLNKDRVEFETQLRW